MITKEHKEFQERMRLLLAAFAQELPQRISEIAALWNKLRVEWDTKALQEKYFSVHHLVSNGKTFGYPELSAEARALEQTLKRMLAETIPADDALADHILQQIAQILQENLRQTDVIGRWGGEEFIIILPHTPMAKADSVAEHLRYSIEHYPFGLDQSITISIGIGKLFRDQGIHETIKYIDSALYEAKNRGRNRICHAE